MLQRPSVSPCHDQIFSTVCRALLERFEFLSGRWYELRDVRKADDSKDVVEGEDAADVKGEGALAVEFRCLTCNSNQVSGHLIGKVELHSSF